MSDRWNPKWTTRPVERPAKVFMGGASTDLPSFKITNYRCPVHGLWPALGEHQEAERPCTMVVGEFPALGFCCKPSQRVEPDPEPRSAVEPRGKTWGIRRRGDLEGQVKHAYRCPVHGVFEAMVPRSEVPDAVPCPAFAPLSGLDATSPICRRASPWAGSSCGIGHAAGEVMS